MTTPTITTAAEMLAEQEPGLIAGYLADTARTLTDRVNLERTRTANAKSDGQYYLNELTNERDATARFVEALKEWADREKVDSDFDDVLVRFGFDRRTRSYRVDLYRDVTTRETVSVYVNATDEDDARDQARELEYNGRVSDWENDGEPDYGSVEVDYVEEDEG